MRRFDWSQLCFCALMSLNVKLVSMVFYVHSITCGPLFAVSMTLGRESCSKLIVGRLLLSWAILRQSSGELTSSWCSCLSSEWCWMLSESLSQLMWLIPSMLFSDMWSFSSLPSISEALQSYPAELVGDLSKANSSSRLLGLQFVVFQ